MTNRYGSEPLGKSVEEIEDNSANRVNSPVEGEQRRAQDTAGVPAAIPGNSSGAPALVNPGALIESGSGPDDGAAPASHDSAEE